MLLRWGTCAWALWHNRNEVRLVGVRKSGTVLLQWALQYYLEVYSAASELSPTSSGSAVHGQTWSPPLDLTYKVNVDGATFSELGVVGIRVKKLENLNRIERISLMEKKITRNGINE